MFDAFRVLSVRDISKARTQGIKQSPRRSSDDKVVVKYADRLLSERRGAYDVP